MAVYCKIMQVKVLRSVPVMFQKEVYQTSKSEQAKLASVCINLVQKVYDPIRCACLMADYCKIMQVIELRGVPVMFYKEVYQTSKSEQAKLASVYINLVQKVYDPIRCACLMADYCKIMQVIELRGVSIMFYKEVYQTSKSEQAKLASVGINLV